MLDYNKRLVEVDEILNYLSEEDLMKIPEDVRKIIKENKDKEYVWKYDENKTLDEQDINRDTIAFLSYLNIEYLLNEEQKQLMKKIHEVNEIEKEKLKAEKYKVEDLFERNNEKDYTAEEKIKEKALVEYKEKFFIKIIDKIKKVLVKKFY